MIDRFIDLTSLFQRMDNGTRSMAWMFAVSALGHLVFFLILIFLPTQLPAKRHMPSVINVRMVSPPGTDLAARPGPRVVQPEPEKIKDVPQPEVTKPDKPEPVPVAAPEPPKAVAALPKTQEKEVTQTPLNPVKSPPPDAISVAPKKKKIKHKTSLKKKTFRSDQVIKRAIKRIEKKSEVSRPNTVKQAIDRLRSEVKETEAKDEAPKTEEIDDQKQAAAGMASGGGDFTGFKGA